MQGGKDISTKPVGFTRGASGLQVNVSGSPNVADKVRNTWAKDVRNYNLLVLLCWLCMQHYVRQHTACAACIPNLESDEALLQTLLQQPF